MSSDYEVGYRKPPKQSQFKPGQSGNTKGRPKRSRNFKTDLMETLEASVKIKQNGQSKTVSTQKAALLRLCEKAMGGDPRAIERFLHLAQVHNGENLKEEDAETLSTSDQDILEAHTEKVLRRAPDQEPIPELSDMDDSETIPERAQDDEPTSEQPATEEQEDDNAWLD